MSLEPDEMGPEAVYGFVFIDKKKDSSYHRFICEMFVYNHRHQSVCSAFHSRMGNMRLLEVNEGQYLVDLESGNYREGDEKDKAARECILDVFGQDTELSETKWMDVEYTESELLDRSYYRIIPDGLSWHSRSRV